MAKIKEPTPVKLFTGMLSQNNSLFDELTEKLISLYGPVDVASPIWPWDHTRYYEKEMGPGLKRKFIFFEKLVNPGNIAEVKLKADELEKQYLNKEGGRMINLDPGYLDEAKLVLASAKNFSHKIYLDHGIYGELTLYYADNNYRAMHYTFPDYKSEEYLEVFRKARKIFRQQFK